MVIFPKPLWRIVYKLISLLILLAIIGLFFLDQHIRHKFEGKRWPLASQVYARPLELYVGAQLSVEDIKIELTGLGYHFTEQVARSGQAHTTVDKMTLYTRGFDFTDTPEPAQLIHLTFADGVISNLTNQNQQTIPLVRLSPILIGGIYPLNNENRDLVPLDKVPTLFTQALIAIEDRDFYQHIGISLRGIARATLANIRAGRLVQGGSTLTQQLIKNFYLTSERSLARKLLELPMALLLEYHYSKAAILEAYINEVYVGQSGDKSIHGFGLAAYYYFAKPLQDLELEQWAFLAGLVKGPSSYNPRKYPDKAKQRRNLVLQVMYEQKIISEQAYHHARQKPLGIVANNRLLVGAYPAYLDLVKRQVKQDYPEQALRTEGLRIFTNLDPIVQHKAEKALAKTLARLTQQYGPEVVATEGSMVITQPQTGEILALIGGSQPRYKGFNRALDAKRAIGSLIKPAIFLSAIEQDYHLASLLDDSPLSVPIAGQADWRPQNFDHRSHDPVLLHQALTYSYNISTVRLGLNIGLDHIIDTARRLGLAEHMPPYPSLLLGAQGMTALDVTRMYQTIAANGFILPLRSIRHVSNHQGQALTRYPYQIEQRIDNASSHLLQYQLKQVMKEGTGRSAYRQLAPTLQLAGKTGTSNAQRDSWFAGFSGNRLAVVWLGHDDNRPLPFTGASGALQVWINYMATESLTPLTTPVPDNIQYHWINRYNGKPSAAHCRDVIRIPFKANQRPLDETTCYSNESS